MIDREGVPDWAPPLPDNMGVAHSIADLQTYMAASECEWENPDCTEPIVGGWLLSFKVVGNLQISWCYCALHAGIGPAERLTPTPIEIWEWVARDDPR